MVHATLRDGRARAPARAQRISHQLADDYRRDISLGSLSLTLLNYRPYIVIKVQSDLPAKRNAVPVLTPVLGLLAKEPRFCKVKLEAESIYTRGLGLDEVADLIRQHGGQVCDLYEQQQKRTAQLEKRIKSTKCSL